MTPLDIAAIRARLRPEWIRGDEGGQYISTGWAEMVADNAEAACARVEELEAAITQALALLAFHDVTDANAVAAVETLRAVIQIPEGP
jgi:hypothetical protein